MPVVKHEATVFGPGAGGQALGVERRHPGGLLGKCRRSLEVVSLGALLQIHAE